jgi:hypothetical protein
MVFSVTALLMGVVDGASAGSGPCTDKHALLSSDQASGSTADCCADANPFRGLRFARLAISLDRGLYVHAHHSNARREKQRAYFQALQLTHESEPPAGNISSIDGPHSSLVWGSPQPTCTAFNLYIYSTPVHSPCRRRFDKKRADPE